MNKLVLSCVITMALTACSSDPDVQRLKMQEDIAEKQFEKSNQMLEQVPAWFISPPNSDQFGFFGTGSGISSDLQHAIKKATLQAEFQLAKNYKQVISGSERVYEREVAGGDVVTSTEFLIDKLVDSVPLVGYDVVEQEVLVTSNGGYQVFSLLKLPYDEFNIVLKKMQVSAIERSEKEAFAELERRLLLNQQKMASDQTVPPAENTAPSADVESNHSITDELFGDAIL